MIHDKIEFHNVAELRKIDGHEGLRIQRVPEHVRAHLRQHDCRGQRMMLSPSANVELRFLLISDSVDITLSASNAPGLKMQVYWGEFSEGHYYDIKETPTTITLEPHERYRQLDEAHIPSPGFSKRMVRLMFSGDTKVSLYYHGLSNGEIRTPAPEDKPARTLLAYGTSITHCSFASGAHLTYPHQTARALGMDLINLGSAGTAFCEGAVTDYIAGRNDWDMAILALSVNMYGSPAFTLDDFKARAAYMVNTIAEAHPDKPLFCITLYPFFDDVGIYLEDSTKNHEAYRQALRDIVRECDHDRVHLIEGPKLLTDITLLANDLLHPTDLGLVQMGQNLARRIQSLI